MKLCLVVAIGRNGIIGKGGKLPWHIPEDMSHFRSVTMSHAVIMGRKTYESIGKPLVRRRNIVISSSLKEIPGCEVVSTIEGGIELARCSDNEPRIIGGRGIYASTIALATDIYLTEVIKEYDGDEFFPEFNRLEWKEVSSVTGVSGDVRFVHLVRF